MYQYTKEELFKDSREKYKELLSKKGFSTSERCFNLLYGILFHASESGFTASDVMEIYDKVIFED